MSQVNDGGRLWAMQCPNCRYDMGVQQEDTPSRCAECGRLWTPKCIELAIQAWESYWRKVLLLPPLAAPLIFYVMWCAATFRLAEPREGLVYWLVFAWVAFSWSAACVILIRDHLATRLCLLLAVLPLAYGWTWFSLGLGSFFAPQLQWAC